MADDGRCSVLALYHLKALGAGMADDGHYAANSHHHSVTAVSLDVWDSDPCLTMVSPPSL